MSNDQLNKDKYLATRMHTMTIRPSQDNVIELRRLNLDDVFYLKNFKHQKDLATVLGITPSTLTRYLNGKQQITYDAATRYEELLRLPKGYLSTEKSRVYVLANVKLSGCSDPINTVVNELTSLNLKFSAMDEYGYTPISAVRPTIGQFDLIITIDLFNTSQLNHVICSINGITGIGSTSSLVVMSKYEMGN